MGRPSEPSVEESSELAQGLARGAWVLFQAPRLDLKSGPLQELPWEEQAEHSRVASPTYADGGTNTASSKGRHGRAKRNTYSKTGQ